MRAETLTLPPLSIKTSEQAIASTIKTPSSKATQKINLRKPIRTPDVYSEKCPWDKKQTLEKWISERVLKLTCTSNDMRPLAKAAEFKEGVHKWKEDERSELMTELDAAYFLLYGIKREDVEYILSTFSGTQAEEKSIFKSGWPFERILRHYDELCKK